MILRQILNSDLGCASYLIADADAGVAAVVDPRADISAYLEAEQELGVRITDVVETHNHADHVSGRPELIARGGVTAHIHRLADAEYPHQAFDDGDVIDVGSVRLQVLHTPGHRPEHCALIVIDAAQSTGAGGGAHRRQPVRGRRRPPRPGDRGRAQAPATCTEASSGWRRSPTRWRCFRPTSAARCAGARA